MGLCHQVTVLDYGTVVAAGPPEVAASPRVLDAYLGVALDDEPATAAPVADRPDGGAADHPLPAAARRIRTRARVLIRALTPAGPVSSGPAA